MTTLDFIYNVKEMGYKVNWSHRNVSKRKTKIQISKLNEKQPIAWVFTNEMYSMRSLGVDSELYELLFRYCITPIEERGEI
ncbi:hypothetical protein QI334_03490 [Staphylococcus saprophyticus]|uniref:hypothetical protein n=1 Tax=Staphylococcus saprophyticus TaxID=29385 RepID=UPI00076B3B16|nr:hypothetical protein [Staphylococcus saprophyticus]AMG20061.1 hypothetical protein AL528_07630 [Staphylococcus saprophyticus]MDW3828445.1 hypothetical protein [Staphylococcus saprophyticus]MDW3914181.1 hypothetical protein [Staphylococcus saprophyticus]MDW3963719.1 hypothetical protein [Staphylococcus saprophyticus]MDW3965917.1 hypothetical protein [Staphylococcus saprophyticus]